MKNRLIIYFFYDAQGKADRYIDYALSSLVKHSSDLLVVCNGILDENARELFLKFTKNILVRKNEGFDVWAYKDAMDSLGWDKLCTYDEVILMNYTIMGPIHPLSDVFNAMDAQPELDFWGLTKCFEERSEAAQEMWQNPYGYIPEHVQSSFMGFRQKFIQSKDFQEYWDNMIPITSYFHSGGSHEQVFTKLFADKGYKWNVYTNTDDMEKEIYTCSPLINYPMEMVKDKKTPFFKRRTFFVPKTEFLNITHNVRDFIRYLENETDYEIDMIYESLIRNCSQRDIAETLLNTNIIDL